MGGGGPDYQEGKGLPWNWPCGGNMEGSGRDFESLAHILHHLPRLPPQISGRFWNRYRHPRGQAASEVSVLEGGSPVRDLPGPSQGVLRLGQVQVPGYLGRLHHGPPIMSAPPDVLETVDAGGKGGRLLRDGVSGILWSDTGRSALLHHIQCGGGCGGETLGDSDGEGCIGAGRAWT